MGAGFLPQGSGSMTLRRPFKSERPGRVKLQDVPGGKNSVSEVQLQGSLCSPAGTHCCLVWPRQSTGCGAQGSEARGKPGRLRGCKTQGFSTMIDLPLAAPGSPCCFMALCSLGLQGWTTAKALSLQHPLNPHFLSFDSDWPVKQPDT